MSVTPFVIETFGGLNVADDPEEVALTGATGVRDIDFDRRGRLRSRNGFTSAKQLTLTTAGGIAAFENSAGLKQFVVGYLNGATKKYEAYSSSGGAAVASATPTSTLITGTARIGTTSGEYLYIANGLDTLWRWDGAAFTQPAGCPAPWYLTLSPTSNRLVAAITANNSRVQFSDAGAPETWGANNFVDLTPGDGSPIYGMATWQNKVFVFKRRRFFVFGPESVAAAGTPVFNYDTVDGYGTIGPPVAGDEGVYFFDGRTIWVTTGNVPRRVSGAIEPALRGDVALAGFTNAVVDQASLKDGVATLSYSLGRLYLSVVLTVGGRIVFVYDPKLDKWTVYSQDLRFFVTLRRASTDREYTFAFGNVSSTAGVYYLDPTSYVDFWDGGVSGSTIISWYYVTGLYAIGPPERVAVTGYVGIVGNSLDASGAVLPVTASITTDTTVTVNGLLSFSGSSSGVGDQESWAMADTEGRRWQMLLTGSGGQYVSRVIQEVMFVKPAGVF